LWPVAATARAVAAPMPEDAPVMTATRPVDWLLLVVSLLRVRMSVYRFHRISRPPREEGTGSSPLSGS
jgi:hypothetical protein